MVLGEVLYEGFGKGVGGDDTVEDVDEVCSEELREMGFKRENYSRSNTNVYVHVHGVSYS